MRTASHTGRRLPVAAGLLLALAACSREAPRDEPTAAAPAPAPATAPAATLTAEVPAPPPEAAAVDATLAEIRAFNAKAAEELAGIGRAERRIRDQAARALELAGRAGAVADAERSRLSGQVVAARSEAERAHAGLTAGLAALQTASAEKTAQLEAALKQCAEVEALAGYAGCAALSAEQPLLAQNVTALGERQQAAEAVWRQERARLDEASAVLALGR